MAIATEITFHDLARNDSVAASIERWVSRLEHLNDRIADCQVRVEQRRRAFAVHVTVNAEGTQIVATSENVDVYVAVADAFRAARRDVLEIVKLRRRPHRGSYVSRYATI